MPFLHNKKKKLPWFKWAQEESYSTGWRCKIFRPTGGYYKGNWKRNFQTEKGVQLLPSGYQYEGDWLLNKKNGFGVLSKYCDADKVFQLVYIGDYEDNKKNGYGSLHYDDGALYEGQFKNDKREGFGRCWFADGSYYEGYWHKDFEDGYGMFVQANGNRYEGEWQRGKKDGFGEYYHLTTGQKQLGYWENDMCKTSWIEDIKFRQAATIPTPYTIRKFVSPPNIPFISFLETIQRAIENHHKSCDFHDQSHKFSVGKLR